jgi:hypothetical protein
MPIAAYGYGLKDNRGRSSPTSQFSAGCQTRGRGTHCPRFPLQGRLGFFDGCAGRNVPQHDLFDGFVGRLRFLEQEERVRRRRRPTWEVLPVQERDALTSHEQSAVASEQRGAGHPHTPESIVGKTTGEWDHAIVAASVPVNAVGAAMSRHGARAAWYFARKPAHFRR